jgi:N-acetylglucosaminyl-diphospho-decaprenol L-rhamnosyltransferase
VSAEIVAVVPTLGAPTLGAALASLRRQGQAIDVTVVHQGSVALGEAVTALADRVLSFPHPLGFAAAVNAGLAVRSGQAALLLNDDAELLPGWLAAALPALAATPRLAAVQGVNLRPGAGTVDGAGIGWNRWWQAVQLAEGREPPDGSGDVRAVFGVSAAAALFRSSALAAVATGSGPFERDLDTYYEDVELAGRLRAAGFRAALVPAARAVHHGGASAPGRGRRDELLRGNRLLAMARLLGRAFPARLPRALLRDLLDVARQPTRLPGLVRGWRRSRRLLPRFAHAGPPQVPLTELRRLAAEEFR